MFIRSYIMASREQIHSRISDLLETLNINNNRLSLHAEDISNLDLEVLRKQCIDLYEQIGLLALADSEFTVPEVKEEIVKQVEVNNSPIVEEHVEVEQEELKEEPSADEVEDQVDLKQEEKRSIHMKHQDEAEMVSLFEKFNSKPIDNISKAITISKRFEFQNNFFEGDAGDYKKFIGLIDAAQDREDAFQIYHEYKNRLGWDNEELKDELKSLLYRKYAT